eukprot:TRINITY_DN3149_c5_g1_i2.p1 TRINITY_DN3149_c5_g1~~TRINITY_DN3149_c5_g1_i2.p1  ORF type:complete len:449 (+),score=128.41 TRINITY_DN3149_c5_g1_i2:66-1412(+)
MDFSFPEGGSIFGNVFLMAVYAYILSKGSNWIADGSERLTVVLDPGIVGGFLLPVLGAIPDAAIILFSCLGDPTEVQEQVTVGLGVLAGSTIMLLTIPWFISLIVGRCDMISTGAVDGQCSGFSLTKQGVTVLPTVKASSYWALLTSLTYIIVTVPAIIFGAKRDFDFVLCGLIFAGIMFVVYSVFMVMNTKLQEQKTAQAKEDLQLKIRTQHFYQRVAGLAKLTNPENTPLLGGETDPGKKAVNTAVGIVGSLKAKTQKQEHVKKLAEIEADEADDEEEEMEEGMTKGKVALQACFWMLLGTSVVAFFSDPMVEVMSALASDLKLSPFYVSFIISPLASNASEIIASISFAKRRRRKNITLTYSALYGAATMNNTLCLGLMLGLVYWKKIAWDFTAEVATTMVVMIVMSVVGVKLKNIKVWWFIPVMLVYPLSIFGIYILTTVFNIH